MAFSASATLWTTWLGSHKAGRYEQCDVGVSYRWNDKVEDIDVIKGSFEFEDKGNLLLVRSFVNDVSNFSYSVTPSRNWYWDKSLTDNETRRFDNGATNGVITLYHDVEGKKSVEIEFSNERAWITMDKVTVCPSDGLYYFGVSRMDVDRGNPVETNAYLRDWRGLAKEWTGCAAKCTFAELSRELAVVRVGSFTDDGGTVPAYSSRWGVRRSRAR